jgi:hypothetical protein
MGSPQNRGRRPRRSDQLVSSLTPSSQKLFSPIRLILFRILVFFFINFSLFFFSQAQLPRTPPKTFQLLSLLLSVFFVKSIR